MKALLLLALLSGCASERFFTEAEDAEARKNCQQGCAVVPIPLLRELLGRIGTAI